MKATNMQPLTERQQQVKEIYERTRSLARTARELGITKQAVADHVMYIKMKGYELPPARKGRPPKKRGEENAPRD